MQVAFAGATVIRCLVNVVGARSVGQYNQGVLRNTTVVLNTVYLVSIMHHACNEREDILYSCTAWKVGMS